MVAQYSFACTSSIRAAKGIWFENISDPPVLCAHVNGCASVFSRDIDNQTCHITVPTPCSTGYEGYACRSCSAGYIFRDSTRNCEECGYEFGSIAFAVVGVILGLTILYIVSWKISILLHVRGETEDSGRATMLLCHFRRILLTNQMLVLLAPTLRIQWGAITSTLVHIMRLAQ